ncbi:MAG: ABC transporter permease [Candidatus Riflebacteria bacterium]|nr:ABC transporter permease [Candidatus Riflebacteria bacterium]
MVGATPLVLAGLGGVFAERSGVINIGLEGFMLFGAFFSALVAAKTGRPVLALLVSTALLAVVGLVFALFTVTLKANQVVSGVALNMLASGLTLFLSQVFFDRRRSFSLPDEAKLDFRFFVVLALILVPLCTVLLDKTRFGLRLRAVGENPKAADTAGVSVPTYRYLGLVISGILAGLAGSFLPFYCGSFAKNMTAGRGFIALAALIFGRWRPAGVLSAALVFGLADALQTTLLSNLIPSQFAMMVPYVVTVVILAGFIGRAVPPASLGIPYEKESR